MLLYVLYKEGEPHLEICEVVSRTEPVPQFGNTTYNAGYQMPMGQKMTVDVKVKNGNGEVIDFQKLPADLVIADFGSNGIVISESREAMQAEIAAMQKASVSVLDSVEKHKRIVELCDSFMAELNPQVKQEAERSKELERLKSEVSDLRGDLIDIKGMIAKALNNRKSKED